jgi:hypothetical protein
MGASAALAAACVSPLAALAVAGGIALAAGAAWTIEQPARWIAVFLVAALVLPPLPIPLGDSGPHPAVLAAGFGVLASLVYATRWRQHWTPAHAAIAALYGFLTLSLAMAVLHSGASIALQSTLRVLLAGCALLVFWFETWGPGTADVARLARGLFYAGAAAALFACLDFYFQWPPLAGFGPQYVWLDTGVFRRAQGLFYEASTLGNMCAFFLAMVAVAALQPPGTRMVPRPMLLLGAVPLAAALLLSYSRASVLNVATAGTMLLLFHRSRVRWLRVVSVAAPALIAGLWLMRRYLPEFLDLYWTRWWYSGSYLLSSTGRVLSGRLDSWQTLARYIAERPWDLLLGIGYKTLPYTRQAGEPVVADNMYLSLLVETGIGGLAALLALNAAILVVSWRAARGPDPLRSFFAQWMLAFWAGQSVQMLSGDLLTYWRVLPLYFWVLAMVVRR